MNKMSIKININDGETSLIGRLSSGIFVDRKETLSPFEILPVYNLSGLSNPFAAAFS